MNTKYCFEFWEPMDKHLIRRYTVVADNLVSAGEELKRLFNYYDNTPSGEESRKRYHVMFTGLRVVVRPLQDSSCNLIKYDVIGCQPLTKEIPNESIGGRNYD